MPAKVKPGDRKNHSAIGKGKFPINSKAEADSALKLRGHGTTPAQRKTIIRKARKYLPAKAKTAEKADDKKK